MESSLRINRDKCQAISIKAEEGLMADIAETLGCETVKPPFCYLGLPVGCRHKKARDWTYVIDKVRERLWKWRNLKISLAGRATLVNAVLSAVPLYALSVFRAPLVVLRKIASIQQSFLWGGREGERKIVWVKWNTLARSKKHGGLGVRDLRCMNMALMGKWGWRALQGEDQLWAEVAVSTEDRGSGGLSRVGLLRPVAKVRGWWGDVIGCLRDSKGEWFLSSINRSVGNGERTSFWNDGWVSERPLSSLYPRLFELCLEKNCPVSGAGTWEGESWVWGVGWRRALREWEVESLAEITNLLTCRKTISYDKDRWNWKLDSSGVFTVRSGYRRLVDRKDDEVRAIPPWSKLLWRCWAIPKARATAWRVLVGRIATKVELARRGALGHSPPISCPLCGEEDESVNHLFLTCRRAWELWTRCLEWLGVQFPLPRKVEESFSIFCQLGGGKRMPYLLAAIWSCVIWNIWKKRNDIVFNGGEWNRDKMVEEIKSYAWSWGAGNKLCREKGMRFRQWCTDAPLSALDHV